MPGDVQEKVVELFDRATMDYREYLLDLDAYFQAYRDPTKEPMEMMREAERALRAGWKRQIFFSKS